ncbi:MAG: oligosaccharide flippase family protein [Prevotellaceae bacterium]|nr:oligosaccharide flippase family protein [Candidatus Colivivens caballi]
MKQNIQEQNGQTPATEAEAAVQGGNSAIRHVLKYTGLFGSVQGINMLVSLLRNKLTAWLLGPAGIGLINLFNSLTKFIGDSTNFGISFSAVKHVSELFEEEDTERIRAFVRVVRTWSLLTALLGTIVCVIAAFFHDHTTDIIIVSPIVGILALMGGEMAILKGMKELKRVAKVSVASALSTLVICVPLYYLMGLRGVSVALLVSNIAVLAIYLSASTKVFPYVVTLFSKQDLKAGLPMIRLGVGYIVAGVFGSGAQNYILESINDVGGEAAVGLYSSGYVMMVQYASVVLASLEADYFPRLSGICHDRMKMNGTVNHQIEVCTLLLAPMLVFFVIAMPYLLQLLYSQKFVAAVPMAVCASFYIFFKALFTPVEYLPLAKGDSVMYMTSELIYDIFVAIAVPWAYCTHGLWGAGFALSVGGLIELIFVNIVYRYKYHYAFCFKWLPVYLVQFSLLCAAVAVSFFGHGWMYWVLGIAMLMVSAAISFLLLKKEMKR